MDSTSSLVARENCDALISQRWLGRLPTSKPAVRLFCFPYAGGDTLSIYNGWVPFAGNNLEIIPVLLPGRGRRVKESSFESINEMINALVADVAPLLRPPFALLGHSMGGLIAFEFARRLEQTNRTAACVFVSGCAAPHHPPSIGPMHDLPDAEFLRELRRLNGTGDAVFAETELMSIVLPALRADFKACQTHACRRDLKLRAPIVVFGGTGDEIPLSELEGWAEYTTSGASIHMMAGDHFFLRQQYRSMIEIIRKHLQYELARPMHSMVMK